MTFAPTSLETSLGDITGHPLFRIILWTSLDTYGHQTSSDITGHPLFRILLQAGQWFSD